MPPPAALGIGGRVRLLEQRSSGLALRAHFSSQERRVSRQQGQSSARRRRLSAPQAPVLAALAPSRAKGLATERAQRECWEAWTERLRALLELQRLRAEERSAAVAVPTCQLAVWPPQEKLWRPRQVHAARQAQASQPELQPQVAELRLAASVR
jgi:hypothetical protein